MDSTGSRTRAHDRSHGRASSSRARASGGLAALAIAGVLLTTGMTGCATEPRLSDEASAALHARVVDVAERSAAGDLEGAVAELDLLAADVAEASSARTIGEGRVAEIDAAIALVRADLQTLIAAQTPPVPSDDDAGDEPGPGADKGKGKGKGEGKGNGKHKGEDD